MTPKCASHMMMEHQRVIETLPTDWKSVILAFILLVHIIDIPRFIIYSPKDLISDIRPFYCFWRPGEMVKNLGILPDFRHHCRRAHIYTDIHDCPYILIYFLVIATSPNHISFTLILMEPVLGLEPRT